MNLFYNSYFVAIVSLESNFISVSLLLFLFCVSCVQELCYLLSLRFLQLSTVLEILQCRHENAQLDQLVSNQLKQHEHGSTVDELKASKELAVKQLQSSVRDQVSTSMLNLNQLQEMYTERQDALATVAQSASAGGSTSSALVDLLGSSGTAVNNNFEVSFSILI